MTDRIKMTAGLALAACVAVMTGCQSQRTFASPEEAAEALTRAVAEKDRDEVREIFGSRVRELRTDDPDQDKADLIVFHRAMERSREIERREDGSAVLVVGEARWPFAVPLVLGRDGWRFDTDAGIEELENRRIGRNELRTVEACRTIADAQAEYFAVDRDGDGVNEYAQRLMSSPGNKDGLYWPSPGGVDPSPIGPVLAEAAVRTDERGERLPYNGYQYRTLLRQGAGAPGGAMEYLSGENLTNGWALIAWPAEYNHTGVMSFIASSSGVIYEADLGPDTDEVVDRITAFDPAGDWRPLSE
jgi:hypothetical protein